MWTCGLQCDLLPHVNVGLVSLELSFIESGDSQTSACVKVLAVKFKAFKHI